MSRAGQCIENPVTGERSVVRVGTEDSGEDRMVVELFLRPGGRVSTAHVHPTIAERFTAVRGEFGLRLGRAERVAELGHTYDVPAGIVHDFWNAGTSEAQIVIEIAPARRFEEAIKNSFGFAHDGLTNAKGMPRLLQLAAWVDEFSDVLYPASPPRPVQRLLIPPLAALARLRGVPGSHARYRDWDGPVIDIDPWVSPMESALPAPPPDSAFPRLPPRPAS
jgi:mannose-6-phosphate isomerase-like protein (cupin superfamily)